MLSRLKSKTGRASILLTRTTLHFVKTSGYLSGLSSPSGTERMTTFSAEPVSNSAGHTRLPTFSRNTTSRSSVPISRMPWRDISASRWHMPPVWSWMDLTPRSAMVFASTSESMSASMTPIRISSLRRLMTALRVVVLPDPGEDMILMYSSFSSFSVPRSTSASASLSSRMLFLSSMTLTGSLMWCTSFSKI